MTDFSKLPIELINIIINYTDIVVYRNGKYLNRIKKDDNRYNIIKKKMPIWVNINKWTFYFIINNNFYKKRLAIQHTYNPNNNFHYLTNREYITLNDGSVIAFKTNYIFDLNGECHKIVNYVM